MINYDVPLNSRGNNANLRGNVLDDQTMTAKGGDSMLICKYCRKESKDINEFVRLARERHCTPEQAVAFDGTYDRLNQRFVCTQCFVSNHRNIGGAQ